MLCGEDLHILAQTWCSATPLYNTSGDASRMEVTLHSPFPRFPAPVCACFGSMMRLPFLCLSVITWVCRQALLGSAAQFVRMGKGTRLFEALGGAREVRIRLVLSCTVEQAGCVTVA